ncbi:MULTISPECIES: SLAP domain-containing protein [Lactobacillus]|uniref:Uncharacterized protein n=1 Tax=Lactobacillus xujianguonis TaxID=2495899 RepID=A0A437SU55_9LACO|nr:MULTISPECIES: SLAP domain-containing protein [Lactobacillus]RVU70473.1 hypothetical protein EJK17_07205 [Lactobacillus xujianguonis]RVU76857.1 hypothetical protein EJK20_03500 [Lactobacillus xujianguonis]
MKVKSILTKTIAAAAFTVIGAAALNTTNHDAQAAVVANDAAVYRVHVATTVYNSYENPAATGQVLAANTDWKVIKTAYDAQGNKWYDLGKNQWVKVPVQTTSAVQNQTSQTTQTQQVQGQSQNYQNYQAVSQAPVRKVSYTSNVTGSEAAAKAWIAGQESGGSYAARNGQYIGKYQLSSSYLGGDYSAANQEKAADKYVASRYGSWTAAKSFWQANGWY